MSDSLIPSFLMSDVSKSLRSLTKSEWCEQIAQVANQKWVTMSNSLTSLTKNERPWANCSGHSPKMSESLAFWGNHWFAHFFTKTQQFPQKTNENIPSPAIRSFLVSALNESLMITHFWWATWAICSHHSLKKRKGANRLFFLPYENIQTKNILVKFCWANNLFLWAKEQMSDLLKKKSNLLICSFIMIDLSKLLTVAHLSWATWAIHSQLLFWHEWPEQFAHSCSFVLSGLSKSLTIAHMIWVIWANDRMSNKWMSKFPTLRLGEDF